MNFQKAMLVNEEELSRLVEKQIREYNPNLHILGQIQLQQESILNNPKLSSDDKLHLFKKLQQRFSTMKHVSFSPPISDSKKNLNFLKRKAAPEDIFEVHTEKSDHGLDEKEEDVSDQETLSGKDSLKDLSELKDDDEKNFPGGDSSSADEGEIEVKDLPRKFNTKFNRLKELLHANQGKISSKARTGEAIIHGQVIKGSKYSDLIKNLYQYSENRNLVGTPQFSKALREIFQNKKDIYPDQYVSNKDFLAQVRHPLSSSSSTSQSSALSNSQFGTGKQKRTLSTPGKSVKVLYLYPH